MRWIRVDQRDDMKNHIVYLQYLLAGSMDSVDAEVLRPIHAHLSAMETTLSGGIQSACQHLDDQVCHWLDLGLSLSRHSIERVLESFLRLERELNRLSPLVG